MANWRYIQRTGELFDPNGKLAGVGYAGRGVGMNNPSMQDVPNMGPLPIGQYVIGAAQDHTHLGPVALPLLPEPSNLMHGRSAFYIHADNIKQDHSASHGCIVLDRVLRQRINRAAAIGDDILCVQAERPEAKETLDGNQTTDTEQGRC